MSKSSKSLNELLHEIRRIEESREVLTKKKIRAIYKQLLKELTAFVAETYTKYSDGNGTLTVAGLQRSAKLAWFLNEIDKNCNEYLPDVSKEIQKLIDTVYEECYIGMVEAVNRSYDLSALNVRPEVMKYAIANNIEKLTLPALLEKNRKEIVYEIKQTVSIGLMNGERYDTMSRQLVDKLDFSYGKANNIVRTETHRNIEAGLMDGAMETQKALSGSGLIHIATWHTMEDERVRPQHRYHTKTGWKTKISGMADHTKMEGVTIIVGDKFKLEPNVYAPCPGMSGTARNDCRCRCFLEYDLLTLAEWEALPNKQENFVSAKGLDKSGESGIISVNKSEWNNDLQPHGQLDIIFTDDDGKDMYAFVSNELGISEQQAVTYADSVMQFTDVSYSDVRAYQRGEYSNAPNEIVSLSANVEEYIKKAPRWNGGITYRGSTASDKELSEYNQHDFILTMGGTASWSNSLNIAKSFSSRNITHDKPNEVIYHCNTQSKGTAIRHLSVFMEENEVLCSKECRYAVEKIEKDSEIYHVYLKEINDNE